MNQCKAYVLKRDQYRLVRGRGFKMHYSKEQCKRKTKSEYCWQHSAPTPVEEAQE